MTNQSKKPVETLRDGSLKLAIWANETENGTLYNAELVRSYTDGEDKWHDAKGLSNRKGEMLRAANLWTQAHNRILELQAAKKT